MNCEPRFDPNGPSAPWPHVLRCCSSAQPFTIRRERRRWPLLDGALIRAVEDDGRLARRARRRAIEAVAGKLIGKSAMGWNDDRDVRPCVGTLHLRHVPTTSSVTA